MSVTKTDKIREAIEAGNAVESPWTNPVRFAREIVGAGEVEGPVTVVEALIRRVVARLRPRRIVVVSDLHIPYHHHAAVRNVLAFIADTSPDVVNINGDLLDCYSISSYSKSPGKVAMQAEFDAGADFLRAVREAAPKAEIHYGLGNHEERLERLLKDNHGLFGLRDLSFERQLRLDEVGVVLHDYMAAFQYGPISVVHGKKVSKHSAYSAKAHLLDYGYDNVVIGHTHRLGAYYHTGEARIRRAYEIGGLFDMDQADYLKQPPNWQNGFCTVDLWEDGACNINLIEVARDGRFVADGKVYR